VVVLSDGQRTLGVSVQEFVGRQELFTKDIHPRLAALPGVGGASILGDGRVVLDLWTLPRCTAWQKTCRPRTTLPVAA
jgi:two-component system, chemotaxis family, sensor kinase CheA